MLIATTFPEMRTQALALATKLNDLVRIMSDIRSEGDKLKAETARLNETRTRLASLLETKKQNAVPSVRPSSSRYDKPLRKYPRTSTT